MNFRIASAATFALLNSMSWLSAQQQVLLPQNQEILLETQESLAQKPVESGQTIQLTVKEDVSVGNVLVVANGASGSALIVRTQKEKEEYSVTILPVSCQTVDGQTLFLNAEEQEIMIEHSDANGTYDISGRARTDLIIQVSAPELSYDPEHEPSPQQTPSPSEERPVLTLPAGLDLPMQLSDECIPANVSIGTTFRLRVKQDVIEQGKLAFPAKSPGIGKVKFINDHQIFVIAVAVTAVDGQLVAVETDNSVAIEFDPEKEDELLVLDAAVPAMLSALCRITVQ